MRHYTAYRLLTALLPARGRRSLPPCLRPYALHSGVVALFGEGSAETVLCFGEARRGTPVTPATFFRTASVSKMVAAMLALSLSQTGALDLDGDAADALGIPLRHPAYPSVPITPRMLLSHTSGLTDGPAFFDGPSRGLTLPEVLSAVRFTAAPPGKAFCYSKSGFGVLGAVLEGASGATLDDLFHRFFPDVPGSFYPQCLSGMTADVHRVLPPRRTLDAAALQNRPLPEKRPDPLRHYGLAHGSLYLTAEGLARIGQAAMGDAFAPLRLPVIPFGARDPLLTQGLGMFILRDETLCPHTVYGHQGLAYGAVNGVFFDPEARRGFALLTGGVSEARRHVLADVNRALIRRLITEGGAL